MPKGKGISLQQLIDAYNEYGNCKAAGSALGITQQCVWKRLRRAGFEIHKYKRTSPRKTEAEKKAWQVKYYAAHKEEFSARTKRWRAANRERTKFLARRWRVQNLRRNLSNRTAWLLRNYNKEFERWRSQRVINRESINRRARNAYWARKIVCAVNSKLDTLMTKEEP